MKNYSQESLMASLDLRFANLLKDTEEAILSIVQENGGTAVLSDAISVDETSDNYVLSVTLEDGDLTFTTKYGSDLDTEDFTLDTLLIILGQL